MKRRFALPVVIACSAHAFLLFGFSKPDRIRTASNPEKVAEPFKCGLVVEEPAEIDEKDDEPKEAKKMVARPPGIDEPPPVNLRPEDVSMTRLVPPPSKPAGEPVWKIENFDGRPGETDGRMGISVFDPSKLDRQPRTRAQAAPVYPHAMKIAGISGQVVVEFVVDESGSVTQPRIVSATRSEFEGPTLRAVSAWRFEPGRRNNRLVKYRMCVPVIFNLGE